MYYETNNFLTYFELIVKHYGIIFKNSNVSFASMTRGQITLVCVHFLDRLNNNKYQGDIDVVLAYHLTLEKLFNVKIVTNILLHHKRNQVC